MKKKSKANKFRQWYRPLLIILLIQLLLSLLFFRMWQGSAPLSQRTLIETTIRVEEVDALHWKGGSRVYVFSDSVKYIFFNATSDGQYPNSKLPDMIRVGDELHLTYFVEKGIFEPTNHVVDAYSENHVLRTLDGYVKSHAGSRVFGTVMFAILEILFWGISGLRLWSIGWFQAMKRKKKRKK
jgi:hypothetical protein